MAARHRPKHELVAALQGRYRRADRAGKARLLNEFCAASGYDRKHAIRLLRDGPPPPRPEHRRLSVAMRVLRQMVERL
jgi:hypothetical protein